MERELFDYDGWDGDPECMIFYSPTLKVQIGTYAPGTKFQSAAITQLEKEDYGKLEFYEEEKVVATFKLHYRVGEEL